jgi:hypothetical protein
MFEYKILKNTLCKTKHQNQVHGFEKNKIYEQNFEEIVNTFSRETYLKKFNIEMKNNIKHNNKKTNCDYTESTKKRKNDLSLYSPVPNTVRTLLPNTCYFLKSNTFISSLLILTDPNFHLLSQNSKRKEVFKLKEKLFINLDNYYKQFSYKKKGFNQSEMQNILTNEKPLDYSIKYYLCDFYEVNIFILDTITNQYEMINEYNAENISNLLIKNRNIYQIVLNDEKNNNIPNLDKIMKENFTKKYSLPKSTKHNWNKYKISELREIASQNYISLNMVNTGKKKNKSEIILELKNIFN